MVQVIAAMMSAAAADTHKSSVSVTFELKNPHGYLSAMDFPALMFFGVLVSVYALYTVAWLLVLRLNYADVVRLQFWVSGVILLGLLENALFLAAYDAANHGKEGDTLMLLAVVVSALKRSFS